MPDTSHESHRRVPAHVLRTLAAVFLAGVIGGGVFLIVAQEAFKKGLTDHRVNGSMGLLLGGEGEQIARRGLLGVLATGILLAVFYWPLSRRVARSVVVKGLGAGVAGFLLWGAVFGPLATGHSTVPAGLFGLDADAAAPVVLLVACLVGGITLVRVFEVVRDPHWWVPRRVNVEKSVEALLGSEPAAADERSSGPAGSPPR